MARRQFNPTTKKFDDRMVVRKQEAFNWGMISDMAPVDIPYNAVSLLVNARGHKNAIRGRTGSRKWTEATLPVAKIETCSLSGNTLTNSGGFTIDDVGRIVHVVIDGKKNVIFVTNYLNDGSVEVSRSANTPDFENLSCVFYDRVNAQFFDTLTRTRYFLIGTDIYARSGRDTTWLKYFIIGKKPLNATSEIYKVGEKVLLANQNGLYIINDVTESRYAYKTNDALPHYKLYSEVPIITTTNPSAYRYIYSYARIKGNIFDSRLNGQSVVEIQTPPVDVSTPIRYIPFTALKDNTNDYDEVVVNQPVTKSRCVKLLIGTGDVYSNTALNPGFWSRLSSENLKPTLYVKIGLVMSKVYLSFATVENLSDIASAIERALYDISIGFRVNLLNSTSTATLGIYHTDPNLLFDIVAADSPVSGESDLVGLSYLTSPSYSYMGVNVKEFRYPLERTDITHYTLYRTKDIYPHTVGSQDLTDPRIANNPDIYGWVADVPVISEISGSITGNVLTSSSGDIDSAVGGAYKIVSNMNTSFRIVKKKLDSTYEISWLTGTPTTGNIVAVTGTDTTMTLTQAGNVVTITGSGVKTLFEESDVGKLVFYSDGAYVTITKILSPTSAETIEFVDRDNARAYCYPTKRAWCDTVSDVVRDGYLSYLPLRNRFFRPLPSSVVSAYDNGILMVARMDSNELYYSDTEYIESIGYNAPEQYNDMIKDGIRCMFVVNDRFTVLTPRTTHTINIRQSTVLELGFGEAYTIVPDPVLVNSTIGALNQFKTARGERGDVMVITGEPAVRFFNGSEYTANYADARIQETHLQLLNENTVSSYSASGGIHIWGYRSGIYDN